MRDSTEPGTSPARRRFWPPQSSSCLRRPTQSSTPAAAARGTRLFAYGRACGLPPRQIGLRATRPTIAPRLDARARAPCGWGENTPRVARGAVQQRGGAAPARRRHHFATGPAPCSSCSNILWRSGSRATRLAARVRARLVVCGPWGMHHWRVRRRWPCAAIAAASITNISAPGCSCSWRTPAAARALGLISLPSNPRAPLDLLTPAGASVERKHRPACA
ncbi:hypothetical protein PsYK624_102770 [Phanerochaete sordida]|uniref:Uncharacterized protein n=1 Tax=Phanerochaete sordida TaxID=48140 RepID=A0A9P3GGY8_9APHY|nr:hypothetical protein PsYK624_102770 [Phanerochaete sordida]